MIEIKVPATTANIGPGFDALGLALELYNTFYIEPAKETQVTWKNEALAIDNKKNLAFKAINYTLRKYGKKIDFHLIMGDMDIPMARGLGSSASAIVGGIYAANYLMGNLMNNDEIIETAVEIEGHSDNVVPAILGGFCISIYKEEKIIVSKVNVPHDLKFLIMIPNYELSTDKARSILPMEYATEDVVFNISRTALLINAFNTQDKALLKTALEDAIHEPYRRTLIKEYPAILDYSYKVGALGTTISSSGPTILSIVDNQETYVKIKEFINSNYSGWDVKLLSINTPGTLIEVKD